MAKAVLLRSGGGSVLSEDLTALKENLLEGTTAITKDSDDEIIEGTMPNLSGTKQETDNVWQDEEYVCMSIKNKGFYTTDSDVIAQASEFGDALPEQVLEGSVFTSSSGLKKTGTIPYKEETTYYATTSDQVIDLGQYLNGNQIIKKLTQTNLSAANILNGVTVTVNNGNTNVWSITGTLNVQSILDFSAAPYSSNQITFTWKNPAKGAFSGVIIIGKTGSYPTSVSDGTRWYKGSGNNTAANGTSSATVSGFTGGTTYYFRAFAYAVKNNAEWIDVYANSRTATATTTKGIQTFTASGTFTVPANVRSIDIFCVGGGGAGGGVYAKDSDTTHRCTGGAGGGKTATKKGYAVTPGQQFVVTIGAGGASVTPTNVSDSSGLTRNGNTTSFGSVLSAAGGNGSRVSTAAGSNYFDGGDGGSGGGGAGNAPFNGNLGRGGNGGSDGSDGATGIRGYISSEGDFLTKPYDNQGAGQGSTTRAFGESSGTLYSGGGGGGGYSTSYSDRSGFGGAGGGGDACKPNTNAKPGSANTGGGGGGTCNSDGATAGAAGGSGICIVRWGY